MLRVIFLILSVVWSSLSLAQERNFFVSPHIGVGEINIDGFHSIDGNNDSVNTFVMGVSGGYKFKSKFLIEADFTVSTDDALFGTFDSYSVSELRILLGYSFELSDRFRIIPKIGFSDWTFESKEGVFLNPGAEKKKEFDGNEAVLAVDFEVPISDLIQLYLSYTQSNFEFGKADATELGIKFSF